MEGIAEAITGLVQGVATLAEWLLRSVFKSIELAFKKPHDGGSRLHPKHLLFSCWPLCCFVTAVAGIFFGIGWLMDWRHHLVDQTRATVEAEADRFWLRQDEGGRPQPVGPADQLAEDSWGNHVTVLVERGLLDDRVTARSFGPDGEENTLDDIVAIRSKVNRKEAMAEEAWNRVLEIATKAMDRDDGQAD